MICIWIQQSAGGTAVEGSSGRYERQRGREAERERERERQRDREQRERETERDRKLGHWMLDTGTFCVMLDTV